jgi:regulator of RNase E activity RraA
MTASLYADDAALFRLVKTELFTAVVGDVLDRLGFTHQFLPAAIKPLETSTKLVGRAMPVLEADYPVDADEPGRGPLSRQPFGLMLAALDDLKPGEVYIVGGAKGEFALWGELMSLRAQALGAAGAVLNGYIRDTDGILALGFPAFGTGSYAQDQAIRGKVVDWRLPVAIGQVLVRPGDLIIGDRDGVLAVPREAEAEAIAAAVEKARGEKTVAKAIRAGLSATEAFAKYGIL